MKTKEKRKKTYVRGEKNKTLFPFNWEKIFEKWEQYPDIDIVRERAKRNITL